MLFSVVAAISQSIFTGLEDYGINPYGVLINGFIATGLAIAIFLIERQKMKRKEKFGRLFILGKLELLIHHLKLITGETAVTWRSGQDNLVMDSYQNVDMFKLTMKLRVFNELNRFNDILPVFSDVVDFNEWYPLHHHVTIWIQCHRKQIKLLNTDIENHRIMENDEEYKTMKQVFAKDYEYWKKYKPNNYDINFVTNLNYPD